MLPLSKWENQDKSHSRGRELLVKIEPPGQQTFSYSPKLNLSTALATSLKR